jgi:hypothetical protein
MCVCVCVWMVCVCVCGWDVCEWVCVCAYGRTLHSTSLLQHHLSESIKARFDLINSSLFSMLWHAR